MDNPAYVTYVVVVYTLTAALVFGYLYWVWRGLKTEQRWAAEDQAAQAQAAQHRGAAGTPTTTISQEDHR